MSRLWCGLRLRSRCRFVGAAGVLAAVVSSAGCVPGWESDPEPVAAAVRVAVPEADDVAASYSLSGFSTNIDIAVVIPGVEEVDIEVLGGVVDRALEAAWSSTAVEPGFVRLSVSSEPFSEEIASGDGSLGGLEGVDLRAAAEEIGLSNFIGGGRLGVSDAVMVERYGEWEKQ